MKFIKGEVYAYLLILLISLIFVSDIFLTNTEFASFDSPVHITSIAQFSNVLLQGEFPVRWLDGMANYGSPIPIVSHQLTNYMGAIITFVTHNPLTSYHVMIFIGILFSNVFYYLFLRIYFKTSYAFVATVLFNFGIYRIINIYVRGAMPEVFSSIFLPLILICMYHAFVKRNTFAAIGLILSFLMLALNHPMMLLIYSFIIFPYFLYVLFFDEEGKIIKNLTLSKLTKKVVLFGILFVLGIGIASYYLIPLNIEIKYFYYGLMKNHLTTGNYLTIQNILPSLPYFTEKDIFPRGHTIGLGLVESISLLLGFLFAAFRVCIQKKKEVTLLEFSVIVSIILIFFVSRFSTILYEHITILSNIQFQWRMLSALMFIPPIFLAAVLQAIKKEFILPFVIFIIAVISFPQLYGKNYTANPQESYYFRTNNVHSVMMNTIWSGKTEDYPVKKEKIGIISGEGEVSNKVIKNASRTFVIHAQTPVRMVDYTFYYPGWEVLVDGQKTPIEYQDPDYRGVITYTVPTGNHDVRVVYENTKLRQMALYLTYVFGFLFILLLIFRKKMLWFLF